MATGSALLAGVFVVYGLVAARLDRWSITAPIVLVLAGAVLGSAGLDVLGLHPESSIVQELAEITLGLLLFADASTVPIGALRGDAGLPARLLVIGLPLMIAFGTLVAIVVLPDTDWPQAALVAAILAPTDLALGLAVVTNLSVPVRIRRALNVESGLNDGIATPFVLLFVAIAAAEERSGSFVSDALRELGIGIAIGVAVGCISGWLIVQARRRRWTTPSADQLTVLSVALLAFAAAKAGDGNAFVCAFVAGLCFGAMTRRTLDEAIELTETTGVFASFVVWSLFGAVLVGPIIRDGAPGRAIAYAVLSLTVIRMASVAIALAGTRLRSTTVLFMGWFGPRGLASVVFVLIADEELRGIAPVDGLLQVATWTIVLSVVLHGLTARPLGTRYGASIDGGPADLPELGAAPEPRLRQRSVTHVADHASPHQR